MFDCTQVKWNRTPHEHAHQNELVWKIYLFFFLSRAQADFVSLSFDTISGSGPNGAIIHYKSVWFVTKKEEKSMHCTLQEKQNLKLKRRIVSCGFSGWIFSIVYFAELQMRQTDQLRQTRCTCVIQELSTSKFSSESLGFADVWFPFSTQTQ